MPCLIGHDACTECSCGVLLKVVPRVEDDANCTVSIQPQVPRNAFLLHTVVGVRKLTRCHVAWLYIPFENLHDLQQR